MSPPSRRGRRADQAKYCATLESARPSLLEGRPVQIAGSIKMKFDWTAETKPASGLSRGAAADCSHGRRPWKGVVRDEAPEGRKSPRRICRAFGALARVRLKTTAFGRGYTMSPLCGSNRSRSAYAKLDSAASRGGEYGSPRLGDHIDESHLASCYRIRCAPQCRPQIFGIRDRSLRIDAHTARDHCVIDVRVFDCRSDCRVRYPALMAIGHTLNMHDLLVIRAIVV